MLPGLAFCLLLKPKDIALPARAENDGGSGSALDAAEERLLLRLLLPLAAVLRGKRSSFSASCSASIDEGRVDEEL